MLYLLFIGYTILFCWLISRLSFFKKSGLGSRVLISLFLVRIIASLIGCYYNLYYYPFSDVLNFHKEGIIEYELLFKNPSEYFFNIFYDSHHNNYSGLMGTAQSFWNDTRSNLIIKMLSIFDIFSFKNFLINTLFFNFLIFFGPVALYRVSIQIFRSSGLPLIAATFLLPSALLFSSMIHRDGLILLALSMVIFYLFEMMSTHFSWKKIIAIILFIALIFLLRNFVFIALMPALIAWTISHKKPKYTLAIFCGIYLLTALLFFGSALISPKYDLPKIVAERQRAFIEIAKTGSSSININPLYPGFRSFFNNTPQAINHSLMRPYITEIESVNYIPFAIEIILIGILFTLFIFFRKKDPPIHPLIYCCVFFSASMFLIIGYTIPIIGAIVRYRSIYFIFLLIPVVCYTDWERLLQKLNIQFKNI